MDLSGLGADTHTAEDLTQEAWLLATRNPPADPSRIRGWFRVVGSRLLRRTRNQEWARARGELFAYQEKTQGTEGEELAEAETLARIRRHVDELPEPYCTAVRMR